MLLAKDSFRLENVIVYALKKEAKSGPQLFKSVINSGAVVSKETFYRELRRLLEGEIVLRHNNQYHLNTIWLNRLKMFIDSASSSLLNASYVRSVFQIDIGEKVTFAFQSPSHLAKVWSEIGSLLLQQFSDGRPVLVYHPHEWMVYSREHSEKYLAELFKMSNTKVFVATLGETALDVDFKKRWSSDNEKISNGVDFGLKTNQYLNVIGDYVITAQTRLSFEKQINDIFNRTNIYDEEAHQSIVDLANGSYRCKIKIIRSPDLSKKWRKRFGKFFVIN